MEKTIKLEAIHLTEEDCYLVKLGNTGRHFEVSGLRLQGCPGSVTVKSLDEIRCYRTIPRIITHYENNGLVLSLEDYQNKVQDLLSKAKDCYDEYVFDNLDDEYKYKKFTRDWIPVYSEPFEEIAPVEFVITEIRTNSGDPDIVSLWNSPYLGDNKLYSFDRHNFSVKYFRELCDEKQLKYSIPSHSGIRYATIEGDYIFDDSVKYDRNPNFIGTLKQCKECKKDLAQYIENKILLKIGKNIELLGAKEVLGTLRSLTRNLRDIQPSSKSRDSFYRAISGLDTLANNIESDIINSVKAGGE